MERVNFDKSAEERNSSENLIQLRLYILWLLNEPTIKELMSEERQTDLHNTLVKFIQQYNTMLQENERLKSTDNQLYRLEKALSVCRKLI